MRELGTIAELAGTRGQLRPPRLLDRHPGPRARRARRQGHRARDARSRPRSSSSSSSGPTLDDDKAEELLQHPGLDFARHYLRTARRYRPHLLTEPEEKLMAEKAQTGRSAWARLFAELMAQVKVDDQPLEVALSRLMHPDRETAAQTAEDITAALEPGLRTRGYIFNTLAMDKSVDDRLRSYTSVDPGAQPLERGERRVGRRARRGGPEALRDPAPLVPPEGEAPRHRQARRLRPHGAGRRRRAAHPVGRRARRS